VSWWRRYLARGELRRALRLRKPRTVDVFTSEDELLVRVKAGYLSASGIRPFVHVETAPYGAFPSFVHLLVREEDEAQARRLLE
jgi:hypothetical protein